jgi:hypothetical protein
MDAHEINTIALKVADIVAYRIKPKKAFLSKSEASNEFGRNNVKNWIETGKAKGHQRASGRIEYSRVELEKAANELQDLSYIYYKSK